MSTVVVIFVDGGGGGGIICIQERTLRRAPALF